MTMSLQVHSLFQTYRPLIEAHPSTLIDATQSALQTTVLPIFQAGLHNLQAGIEHNQHLQDFLKYFTSGQYWQTVVEYNKDTIEQIASGAYIPMSHLMENASGCADFLCQKATKIFPAMKGKTAFLTRTLSSPLVKNALRLVG